MFSATYQVVVKNGIDYKEELVSALKEVFDYHYDEFDKEFIETYIEIKYTNNIDEDKSLIGFDVFFEDDGMETGGVIDSLNEKLNDNDNLLVVFKFYDEYLFNKLKNLYDELFEIEIKLREIVSFIFVDTYKGDYYNLLREIDVKPNFDRKKNLGKDENQRKEYLRNKLENEFFYVLFSDYVKLTSPKSLKQDDLYLIAEISDNYDEFKNNILNRGIKNTKYLNFINNIKEIMLNLTAIRNCVAHYRTPSQEELDNYEHSIFEINKFINEFFPELK